MTDAARSDVGAMVKRRRDDLGLTQEELAERVGKSQRWVSALETGRIGLPRTSTLHAMAEALAIRPADFYIAAKVAASRREAEAVVAADPPDDTLGFPANSPAAQVVAILRDLPDEHARWVLSTAVYAAKVARGEPEEDADPTIHGGRRRVGT